MNLNSGLKFLFPLLLLAIGLSGFLYLQKTKPETQKPQPREKVWQVQTISAQLDRHAPVLTLHGSVENPDGLKAAAPAQGQVGMINVREGEIVASGDVLIELVEQDFDLRIDQAQASVLDIEAQIDVARLKHANDQSALKEEKKLLHLAANALSRSQKLKQQNLSSEAEMDTAERDLGKQRLAVNNRKLAVDTHAATLKQLQGRLLAAQARRDEASLAKQRSRLISPFRGRITRIQVSTGDRVQTNQVLIELYPLQSMQVRARIPPRYQEEIQRALAQNHQLTAIANFGGSRLSLTLLRLGAEAFASGIDGYFRIENDAGVLRIGNVLQLQMERPVQKNLQRVPYQAVYGNDRMYILRNGRMFGITVESIGPGKVTGTTSDLLVRSTDLKDGDSIIITHLPNAATGLKVRTK